MHCSNCGGKLNVDIKFCGKCGHAVVTETQTKIELVDQEQVAKWEKSIRGASRSSIALGWFLIISFIVVVLSYSFSKDDFGKGGLLFLSSVMAIGLSYSFFLIVLGKRLKNINDTNTRKSLWALLLIACIWAVSLFSSPNNGIARIIFIILIIEYILALRALKKLENTETFKSQLVTVEYKIKKKHWLFLIVAIATIFSLSIVALVKSTSSNNSSEPAVAQTQNWQVFNSVQDQFSVMVPAYPVYDSKQDLPADDSSITYSWHSYTSKDSTTIYYVFKYLYSKTIDVSDEDSKLESILNGMVNADLKNKLISSKYTESEGYRALDFLIQNEQEQLKGRIILSGQTPFVLMSEHLSQDYNDGNYNKFINSFHISLKFK